MELKEKKERTHDVTKLSHALSCVVCFTRKDKDTITRLSTDLLDPSLHDLLREVLLHTGVERFTSLLGYLDPEQCFGCNVLTLAQLVHLFQHLLAPLANVPVIFECVFV